MKNLILLAAVAFAATACSDHDEWQNKPDANAITFGTTVQVETKAAVSGTNIPDAEKVGIYGLEADAGKTPVWAASGSNLMDNIDATSNGAGGLDYSPLKEYTEDKVYNFYAYYPYTAAAEGDNDGIKAPKASVAPTLQVTLAKTPDAQADYMYAVPIENYQRTAAESGNTQKLVFKHALTQVRFKFKNTDASAVKIVSIKVTDNDKGTMSITDGTWSSLSATSQGNTFTLYAPASIQEVAASSSFDIPLQLMLFPKTGSEMTNNTEGLTFTLALKDHEGNDKTVTIFPKVPATGLEAGKSYLYTLLYNSAAKDYVTLSTEVVDWVNATGGDLPATPDKDI
nr:fimbrillin family protein [Parabacteroides goldsteinii]